MRWRYQLPKSTSGSESRLNRSLLLSTTEVSVLTKLTVIFYYE